MPYRTTPQTGHSATITGRPGYPPERCRACWGCGTMLAQAHVLERGWITVSIPCRTCYGRGIVWEMPSPVVYTSY